MNKYKTQFKVEYEKDLQTNENLEFNFIRCEDGEIYRYDNNTLGYYGNTKFTIPKRLVKYTTDIDTGDSDITVLFQEKYLKKLYRLLKAEIMLN